MRVPGPLVDAGWLSARIGEPGLVVADCRWYLDGRSGEAAYRAGHIPGAIHVDLDRHLAGAPGTGPRRHPLPSPEAFAAAMGSLGVSDDDAVVGYDDAGDSVAARLWWMLRVTGHESAVLDGGLASWSGPVEAGPVRRSRARFSPRPWPRRLVVDAEVVASRRAGSVLLDARAAERYRGDVEPVDRRAGHVPGAVSAPWLANLDPESGRMLEAGELRRRYGGLGAGAGRDVIVYCGSGVTACHDLLALEVSGLGPGRLYEGSWSDWSSDPSRPVATGDTSDGA